MLRTIFKPTDEARKKGFFINNEVEIDAIAKEEKMQKTIFSELRGVKDASKRAIMDWMQLKINECVTKKEMTIPRLGLRHHRFMKGLSGVYRELEEASKLAGTLYPDNKLDEEYQETFVELITKRLQRQISENNGKVIKPGNAKQTLISESKSRAKALNTIKLSNGEEIVTENYEEMNKQVIKAEMNIIVMRNVVENYQSLARSFTKHDDDELPEYEIDPCICRHRSAWASNIRGGLEILRQNEISSNTLDNIKKQVGDYVDFNGVEKMDLISEFDLLEIQRVADNIIRKPYQDWMYKEKTKIRYNFAEDAKRTWNRIKQPAGQATKISPDIFAEHYSQNWEIEPARIDIDDNSDFIMQRKLVLTENDMLKELLNKKKMLEAISKKGNLSAPGLDKLTYPILKYEKDDAAELLIAIMTMMLRTQKCPTAWKEGKVVMLPKPCNENEKDQPNNW
jgi:hypothetical protein